jgi:hypothetical protein
VQETITKPGQPRALQLLATFMCGTTLTSGQETNK